MQAPGQNKAQRQDDSLAINLGGLVGLWDNRVADGAFSILGCYGARMNRGLL